MSDTLRYVTFDIGGRPVTQLDLNDTVVMNMASESFTVTPPAKTRANSTSGRRYGGSHQVGETTDNGAISWVALVAGASQDDCSAKIEALLARVEESPTPLFIEWVPDGATKATYYDVRGTADWTPEYNTKSFNQNSIFLFKLSIPVAPLARGLQLDILDNFATDTRSDYTYDAGASTNEEVTGGELKAAANVSTENAAIHTARGYQYADNQQTVKGIPGATITGWKNAIRLKRTSKETFLEVYVEDNGTNSILKIDKIIAGVRMNLTTTNLAARVKNATAHWVRGRIEGNIVTAEHFTAAPTPMGAPTTTNTHTLTAGTEIETFGSTIKGNAGRAWIPKTVGAAIDEYSVEPYTYRNATLPAALPLAGSVPGDAPARVDVTVTPSGGAAPPISALIGWARKPGAGLAQAPFGIIEAESAGNLAGWASTANAGARGGKMLLDSSALSTDTYTASWELDPSLMVPDAFQSEIAIMVFARVLMDSTIVSPILTLGLHPADGLNFGAARYTDEWGSAGKILSTPSSGEEKWRLVKLGTIHMTVDTVRPRKWLLWLSGAVGNGSSGKWGIDYLLLFPAMALCASPTSKANDSGYPQFVASTEETSKLIRADLSGTVAKPPAFGHPDHGLGGQMIEMPPGEAEALVKLSSLAPDDPTSNATSEQLAHTATVHFAVTPRWQLLRSGS